MKGGSLYSWAGFLYVCADGSRTGRNISVGDFLSTDFSGSAFVSMMKAAYLGNRKDFAHLPQLHGPAVGRVLAKREMASRAEISMSRMAQDDTSAKLQAQRLELLRSF